VADDDLDHLAIDCIQFVSFHPILTLVNTRSFYCFLYLLLLIVSFVLGREVVYFQVFNRWTVLSMSFLVVGLGTSRIPHEMTKRAV
jgi:hypothetical protein